MRRNKAAEHFAERFPNFADRFERRLKQAVCILAVLLVLSQAALQVPALRHILSTADRLEGTSFMQGSGR